MGRVISESPSFNPVIEVNPDLNVNPDVNISGIALTESKLPGKLPFFGNGARRVINMSGSFTVPDGITSIRVRCIGAGGSGANYDSNGQAGGTSSFGTLISATGGGGGVFKVGAGEAASPAGGAGIGGDFVAQGGKGGRGYISSTSYRAAGGGGAAGSQLGDGGDGGHCPTSGFKDWFGSGGGVGFNDGGYCSQLTTSDTAGGASAFGAGQSTQPAPDLIGGIADKGYSGSINALSLIIEHHFDGFTGGGGAGSVSSGPGGNGGPGAGGGVGATTGGSGGIGGGGAYGGSSSGPGGIGGGGAGYLDADGRSVSGGAGGGYAHGVFTVTPGQVYTVTVGVGGAAPAGAGNGGNGLVIVEW